MGRLVSGRHTCKAELNLKIVHVTECLAGGVLHVLQKLVSDQISRGAEVFIIYSRRPDTPTEDQLSEIFSLNAKRIFLEMSREISPISDCRSFKKITSLLRELAADAVHAHSSKAGFLVRAAAPFIPSRVFYTPHGYSFARTDISRRARLAYKLLEATASIGGARVLACSRSELNLAKSVSPFRRPILVENGVDDYVAKIDFSQGCEPRFKVVAMGRLTAQKAPAKFFALAKKFPHLEFVWIGDGELKPDPSELTHNITITGWLDKFSIYEQLVSSDAFCMLSEWEGLPLALLEAMMVGLPVVVSDIPGCREAVVHEGDGIVCPDLESASRALATLSGDRRYAREMGKRARRKALTNFSSARMCDDVFKAYIN